MEATFWRLGCTEHIRSVNLGMDRQSEWLLCTLSTMEATFWRLGSWCTEHDFHLIMHPVQPSEARLGVVHFIFLHIQICTRLLQGELFKVTMYTAHISSNGSHFLTARVLVYWTYMVSKFGYGRTKWMVTMYSKYTAHIGSNGSHFLTAWFLVCWT